MGKRPAILLVLVVVLGSVIVGVLLWRQTGAGGGANTSGMGALVSGEPGRLCVPAIQSIAVEGVHALKNSSSQPLTIDKVRLVEANGLEVKSVSLAPIMGGNLIGLLSEEPTPGSEGYEAWTRRTPAQGSSIQPGEQVNLVVVLEAVGSGAHVAQNIAVDYHSGAGRFAYSTSKKVEVVTEGSKCS